MQVYYARSADGGVSFGPNWVVTDSGANFSDPASAMSIWPLHGIGCSGNTTEPDPAGFQYEFGDYFGLVATNRQVHPVWVDTRNFNGGAAEDDFEDIATATVTNCSAPVFSVTPTSTKSGSSVTLSWSAPSSWGTGSCGGTYSVQRSTSLISKAWTTIASGLTTTSYTYTQLNGTYYYRIAAKNDCSGTALTPRRAVAETAEGAIGRRRGGGVARARDGGDLPCLRVEEVESRASRPGHEPIADRIVGEPRRLFEGRGQAGAYQGLRRAMKMS
ncbi:MAG: fibronectin type III domain-containing protein [Minicystis sp.]